VPVSEVSTLESTQSAYQTYAHWKKIQRPLVRPSDF
jgi:3D-(3,5/4)-trihydroxycyclohexane-1,2-dione acylhydrolase (decyclizing)